MTEFPVAVHKIYQQLFKIQKLTKRAKDNIYPGMAYILNLTAGKYCILGNIKSCVITVKWFYNNLFSGEDFLVVQKEVHELLKGRILVGHALQNDMKVSWSLCDMIYWRWEYLFGMHFKMTWGKAGHKCKT